MMLQVEWLRAEAVREGVLTEAALSGKGVRMTETDTLLGSLAQSTLNSNS